MKKEKAMPHSLLKRFFLRFALIYVLFTPPWPGLQQIVDAYFRTFGNTFFGGQTEHSEISFERLAGSRWTEQARVVIVNKALMNLDGSGPVRNLDFDAYSAGWRPIVLLAALIYATPIPWKRRLRAFGFGVVAIHAFLIVFLAVGIWSEANELSLAFLAPVTPFWKAVAYRAREVLVLQIGLFIPVLIWGLVTFRAGDRFSSFYKRPCTNVHSPIQRC